MDIGAIGWFLGIVALAGVVVAAIFADRAAGSCHPRVFSAVLAGEGAMAWELRSDDA